MHRMRETFLTPRYALQRLGSEWGRDCYPDVWIDHAIRIAGRLMGTDGNPNRPAYSPQRGLNWRVSNEAAGHRGNVVIPDVRFPNEAAKIRAAGGVLWRTTHGTGLTGAAGAHESERYVDELTAIYEFPDGPLEMLPALVARVLTGSRVYVRL